VITGRFIGLWMSPVKTVEGACDIARSDYFRRSLCGAGARRSEEKNMSRRFATLSGRVTPEHENKESLIPGPVPRPIRPEIRESWLRSEELQIDPLHATATPGVIEERDEHLIAAAKPILDDLGDLLFDTGTATVLTDETIKMLDFRCGDADLVRKMDEVDAGLGSCWAEHAVGTNATALAALLGHPIEVFGREHYAVELASIATAAAPIFDPETKLIAGVLNLSCDVEHSSAHMRSAAVQAARAIEQRLGGPIDESARTTLFRFLAATRETEEEEAIFVLSDEMLLSNAAAGTLLDRLDRASLRSQAALATSSEQGHRAELALLDGTHLPAQVVAVDPKESRAGVIVHVAADAASSSPRARRQVRASAPAAALRDDSLRATALSSSVLIVGPSGSGKLTLARELHEHSGRDKLVIIDGYADARRDASACFFRELLAGTWSDDTTLVVRHIDGLGVPSMSRLRALLAEATEPPPIVATLTVEPGALQPPEFSEQFIDKLYVPQLQQRADAFPEIVAGLMRRHGASGHMQPAAIKMLAAQPWPGNVRELENVIKGVVSSRRTCDITVRDLPPEVRRTAEGRRLTRMEQLERAAIEQALDEAGGNRSMAASILEIGRATLYRKLKAYGLDAECTA
jgi:transcriptional regulator of acetoin/glycerol metabolism